MHFTSTTLNDLRAIASSRKNGGRWDYIRVNLHNIRNCVELMYATRICKTLLNVGGVLEISISPQEKNIPALFNISRSTASATLFKCQDDDFIINSIDKNIFSFKKISVKEFTISLYIMHSGQISELTSIFETAKSWSTSAETANIEPNIFVVGPLDYENDNSLFSYIKYEAELPFGRFLISKKKNFCASICKTNYIAICHSRINFTPDFLKNLYKEFDVLTPQIFFLDNEKKFNYLDLSFVDVDLPKAIFRGPYLPPNYERAGWHKHLRKLTPTIDGGLFICDTEILKENQLDPSISWNESEDLYWSTKLLNNCRILEIDLNTEAYSKTFKLSRQYLKWGYLYKIYSNISYQARKLYCKIKLIYQY